jgi:hypothetical protein
MEAEEEIKPIPELAEQVAEESKPLKERSCRKEKYNILQVRKGVPMMSELRCPECGLPCSDIKFKEDGSRTGVCRNPACKLNSDGIGLVTEVQGAVAAISFPIGGPRLKELMDIIDGKPVPHEPLPEDVGELDGLTFCGGCGAPLFYDGKKYLRHVQDLPQSRLRKLMKVRRFAEVVHKWLRTLRFGCLEHGEQPNPFLWEIDLDEFCDYVATRQGARDLWLLLQNEMPPEAIRGGKP